MNNIKIIYLKTKISAFFILQTNVIFQIQHTFRLVHKSYQIIYSKQDVQEKPAEDPVTADDLVEKPDDVPVSEKPEKDVKELEKEVKELEKAREKFVSNDILKISSSTNDCYSLVILV